MIAENASPSMQRLSLPPDPNLIFLSRQDRWYLESRFFWSVQDPSIESMTQGVGELSTVDLRYTFSVLSLLKSEDKIRGGRVADCGGGIGRVAFQVLTHFFDKIDIVDPIPHYLLKAREYIEKEVPLETFQVGLEDWTPTFTYDAYFIQWTLCHLTDVDLVAFLRRCKERSVPNCLFLIKENVAGASLDADRDDYEYYSDKNSVCRTFIHFLDLFAEAGLFMEEYRIQPNWPKDFCMVVLFILRR
jgi:protein N-terminal methyltransferase